MVKNTRLTKLTSLSLLQRSFILALAIHLGLLGLSFKNHRPFPPIKTPVRIQTVSLKVLPPVNLPNKKAPPVKKNPPASPLPPKSPPISTKKSLTTQAKNVPSKNTLGLPATQVNSPPNPPTTPSSFPTGQPEDQLTSSLPVEQPADQLTSSPIFDPQETQTILLTAYQNQIMQKIMQCWVKPQNLSSKDFCTWLLEISPEGQVVALTLQASSNNQALEISSRHAILAAQPLSLPQEAGLAKLFRELQIIFRELE